MTVINEIYNQPKHDQENHILVSERIFMIKADIKIWVPAKFDVLILIRAVAFLKWWCILNVRTLKYPLPSLYWFYISIMLSGGCIWRVVSRLSICLLKQNPKLGEE